MKAGVKWLLLALALGACSQNGGGGSQPPPSGAGLVAGPIAFPDNFMKSVKEYGAKGDGTTDDTAAIRRALTDGCGAGQDCFGRPRFIYFPQGTYLVSDTLEWDGCCLSLQGQGSGATVIRLRDGSSGFSSKTSPKPVLKTPDGNMSFRQNIWDLAVNTGRNNPGAVGIDWISNNWGAMRNVVIYSEDGLGARGLDMSRGWPGPSLTQGLLVRGFDYGIYTATPEYGPTFENVMLENQKVAGWHNDANTIAVRGLTSKQSGAVPAIQSFKDWSSVILLDAELSGGSGSAVEFEGHLYARNVKASGYASALKKDGVAIPGNSLGEYVAEKVQSLFDPTPPARSLGLPVKNTPVFHDPDLNQWARFTADWYGDTSKLQGLLESGKSTVYFPAGVYFSYDERSVTVPATVRRIVGFGTVVNTDANGKNGGGIRFVVEANSTEPLVIEGFGYGVKVEQRSARPVALKHGGYQYFSTPGAGELYLEDVGLGPFTVQPGQSVWARQFNNEYGGTKITNKAGKLWILGLKTEQAGTVIDTRNGGQTELLGTLVYPATSVPPGDVAFKSVDSRISLIYSVSNYVTNGDYTVQVEETRGSDTRRLMRSEVGGRMALYVGY